MRTFALLLVAAIPFVSLAAEVGQDTPYKTGISRQCPDGKWRRKCDGWTSAVVNGSGVSYQAPKAPTPSRIPSISGTACAIEGRYTIARGIVTAGDTSMKLAEVEVTFYAADGTVMDVGRDYVTIQAHQRAPFEVYGPTSAAARCEYAIRE